MNLLPELEGDVPIGSSGERFLEKFRARVNAGLLSGRPESRSNYTIGAASPGRLEILAADWATATNVGLNRIELQQLEAGVIRYTSPTGGGPGSRWRSAARWDWS